MVNNNLNINPAINIEDEYFQEKTWRNSNFVNIVMRFAKSKPSIVGFVIIAILTLASIFAPFLTHYSYSAIDPIHAFALPSSKHWFGTDNLGRDIFARVLYGGRYSLLIGVCSEMLGCIIGVILGALSGFFGGIVDNTILRICDIIQSIPNILLCICVSQALGAGLVPTIIALCIGGIPGTIRLLRATMLSVRDMEFVEAAKAINCSRMRVIFKHIVPNCMAPVIVRTSLGIGSKITQSASLSYLGLGIQEPAPEWGALLANGKNYFRYYPHLVIIPGIVIAMVVLSFNLLGDGLRDALDPKLKS